VYAVQQHQHGGDLDFNHNSQCVDHQQRHERQFQFHRSFSNAVAAQRDHRNGSEPMHAGQQHNSNRNIAEQSAAPERHGERNDYSIFQPAIFHTAVKTSNFAPSLRRKTGISKNGCHLGGRFAFLWSSAASNL
jgi:hypothetical protein